MKIIYYDDSSKPECTIVDAVEWMEFCTQYDAGRMRIISSEGGAEDGTDTYRTPGGKLYKEVRKPVGDGDEYATTIYYVGEVS